MSEHLDKELELVKTLEKENEEYLDMLNVLAGWAHKRLNSYLIKDFTDHSVEHSKRVMENIDKLVAVFMKQENEKMNEIEIYILLAACYLHDLGMHAQYVEHLPYIQNKYPKLDFSKQTDWNQEIIDVIRKEHHILSYHMVRDAKMIGYNNEEVKIEGLIDDLREYVAVTCLGHRLDPSKDEDKNMMTRLLSDGTERHGKTVRLEMISRLLRIGDALDIDSRRIDDDEMILRRIDEESKIYWYKHHYTTSVSITQRGIAVQFDLPCARQDPIKEIYEIFPSWTLWELKEEYRLQRKYFEEKQYNVFLNVSNEIHYRETITPYDKADIGLRTPQPSRLKVMGDCIIKSQFLKDKAEEIKSKKFLDII